MLYLAVIEITGKIWTNKDFTTTTYGAMVVWLFSLFLAFKDGPAHRLGETVLLLFIAPDLFQGLCKQLDHMEPVHSDLGFLELLLYC